MRISYISAVLAGVVVALSCRSYFVSVENSRMRTEAYEFQQLVESIQPQLVTKRQQLQAQQEKLNKGSAIGQTVGPAVLGDIRASAEKNNNIKLKELLQKYGVRESAAASAPDTTGPASVTKGGN